MFFRYKFVIYSNLAVIFIANLLWSNSVQMITTHNKSNGILLRLVTKNKIKNLDDIAGWIGNENWFYVTLNDMKLSDKLPDYTEYGNPVENLEVSENGESVQLGFLFKKPMEDFEIFHSAASRVILVQVWESIDDTIRTKLKNSEIQNNNRVFSLPKEEAKGSPFYDSFIYARDKYGPEKYFVWYNNWFSTEDIIGDDESHIKEKKEEKIFLPKIPKNPPKPLIVKKVKKPDLRLSSSLNENINNTISESYVIKQIEKVNLDNILKHGMLHFGILRPSEVKKLQKALVLLGYKLSLEEDNNKAIDGNFGEMTENAVLQFQTDMGYSEENIDGIVGLYTLNGLINELKRTGKYAAPEKAYEMRPKKKYSRTKQRDFSSSALVKRKKISGNPKLNLNLPERETGESYIKVESNIDGADVYVDGNYLGKTPILDRLPVRPGWHRVKVINPFGSAPQFVIPIPDYQDIYVSSGRTQRIRFKLFSAEPDSTI